jgi:hypothetical protein
MTMVSSLTTLTLPPEQRGPELLKMDGLSPMISSCLDGPPRALADEPLGDLWELLIDADAHVPVNEVPLETRRIT